MPGPSDVFSPAAISPHFPALSPWGEGESLADFRNNLRLVLFDDHVTTQPDSMIQQFNDSTVQQRHEIYFCNRRVVSSLGKGLTAAALGTLPENRGLKVTLQKFDPYSETRGDSRHDEPVSARRSVCAGRWRRSPTAGYYELFTTACADSVSTTSPALPCLSDRPEQRAAREYLGKTVQVILHVTDEIKNRIHVLAEKSKATSSSSRKSAAPRATSRAAPLPGSYPRICAGLGYNNAIFLHVTYVPYIKAAGELKTKPTQQFVAKLREIH